MKIVHVSDCYGPRLGGIEVQVRELARRQAMAGHQVSVVTSVPGAGDPEPTAGVTVHRPPHGRGGDPGGIRYRTTLHGRATVLAQDADVVHVHASAFSPLAFLAAHAAARSDVPTVVTTHSLWAYAAPLLRAADRLTGWGDWPVVWSAVSTAAAAELRDVLGGRAPVAVLPNGIDPARWRVDPVPADAGGLRVASVMRLAPRKRPRHLLRMLLETRRRLPPDIPLRVEIAGEGPERAMLERFLRRHRMDGWVHLTGRLTAAEVRALYARSDVFVAPATMESFGIAALEARTAGLPVVARAGTGVTEFIRHGREGLLAGSDAEMVDAITRLATTPGLRERLQCHNRRVPPDVTWPDVLTRCAALYRAAGAPGVESARPVLAGAAP